jgi:hypothetical protein
MEEDLDVPVFEIWDWLGGISRGCVARYVLNATKGSQVLNEFAFAVLPLLCKNERGRR